MTGNKDQECKCCDNFHSIKGVVCCDCSPKSCVGCIHCSENKEQETMRERFDKAFDHHNPINDKGDRLPVWNGGDYEQIKDFIDQEISLALSQEREKQKEFPLHLDMPLILLGDISINQHTEKAVSQERSRLLERIEWPKEKSYDNSPTDGFYLYFNRGLAEVKAAVIKAFEEIVPPNLKHF